MGRRGVISVLGLVAMVGCQAPPEAVTAEEPSVLIPVVQTALPSGVTPAPTIAAARGRELAMKTVVFTEGRMRLDVLNEPHEVVPWPVGGALVQAVAVEDDHAIRVAVRAGEGESLDGFVRDHESDELTDAEAMTVCGRPARRMVARAPEEHITCIMYADGRPNSPGYLPAETTIVVAFEHRGVGVTASWEVPTEMRAQYRKLEERFFRSITCV